MMTMHRCFLPFLFLSSYGAAVTAADAELVTRDLFISLDSQPTEFSFTAEGPVGSRSGDDAFDSGFGVSVGGRWSFAPAGSSLGLVLGGDLNATSYEYQNNAENMTFGARLIVGAGYAVTDSLEFLLEPTLEYGYASFAFPETATYPTYDAKGTLFGYGLRLNTIYRCTDRWAVMGAVGWKRISNDLSGSDIDLSIQQEGATFSLGLIYRLSAAPTRVE